MLEFNISLGNAKLDGTTKGELAWDIAYLNSNDILTDHLQLKRTFAGHGYEIYRAKQPHHVRVNIGDMIYIYTLVPKEKE